MPNPQHTSKTLVQKDAMHPKSRHAFQKARVMLRQRRLNEAKHVRDRQKSAKGTCSSTDSQSTGL